MSVLSGYAIILVDMPLPIKWISLILIILSAIYTICSRALLLLPWSVTALTIDAKHQLTLIRKDGTCLSPLVIELNSVVTQYLTIVNYVAVSAPLWQGWFRQGLVILPDNLPYEDYRRLRVWLRWGYDFEKRSE